DRQAVVAALRARFVEGPVLRLPNTKSNTFTTNGMTPIPGAGLIYPTFRTEGEWGSLEAAQVLMSGDKSTLTLPLGDEGSGWTLRLAAGWERKPVGRDIEVVQVP